MPSSPVTVIITDPVTEPDMVTEVVFAPEDHPLVGMDAGVIVSASDREMVGADVGVYVVSLVESQ